MGIKRSQWNAAQNVSARVIQKAWRSRKKKQTVRTIARVEAKKVLNRSTETKSYLGGFNIGPLDDTPNVVNLIHPLSQGTTSETIIGEKFHLKNIHFRFNCFTPLGGSSNSNTKVGRMIVFRTKKPLTQTNTLLTITDLFRRSESNIASRGHVDLSKVSLLYDRTFTLTPNYSGQQLFKPIDFKVRFGTTERFDADNSGYLKNSNIYIALMGVDGSSIAVPIQYNFTYTINFKDD